MFMFRYETHCHTAESSACASASGEKQAKFYKERGFTGIIVTDHFLNANTTAPWDEKWENRVDILFRGYENAKATGDIIGLDVFFGWEYTVHGCDFLTYGLGKEWLLQHPEVMELHPNDYFDLVHAHGGIIVHAHPFREANYIDMIRLFPRKCDGCEVINSCRTDFENTLAKQYADNYGLRYTAGSDNHHAKQNRLSGIETKERIQDIGNFIEILKNGKYKLYDEIFS
ncbi:MAG: histidinol phosphatase [Ruminiclostridium sp.]|nr:histidinol phosphatase [Ruminiclostridium sp.]